MADISVASPAAASAAAPRRLLYVDNLRWVLISLVVTGHLGLTYGAGSVGDWYYKETGEVSEAFVIVALPLGAILTASLLGLFALISGYFTPGAYDRKAARGFLLDRVKRLVVPLVFYEIILNPIINYVRDAAKGSFEGSFGAYIPLFFSPLRSFGDGPVWFLEMLMIFSLAYAGWRLVAPALLHRKRGPTERPVPGNAAIALFAVGLGVATFVVRIWAPFGRLIEPWHQEPAHYPQYIAMFVIGAVAYRSNWLVRFPDRQARLWACLIPVSVVSLGGIAAAAGAFSGELDPRATGGFNWLSLAYSTWEVWTCVAVVIVMLVAFRKWYNHQNGLERELAACAFGVYVLHPVIIVPLAIALRGITMDLSLKFLWVTPLALVLCYGLVYLLRRAPFLRGFL